MKQIRIGYLSTLYHSSHILKGRQDIENQMAVLPQWLLFGTGPEMIEAFSRGALDLGYIGLPPAMIGICRGLPLKCIAGGHIEGTVLIAPAGSTAATRPQDVGTTLGQLAGKKIGAPARGSIHDIIIRRLLKFHAVAGASVVNYPWADLMPQAIADREIAAAAGTPALAAVAAAWYGLEILIPPRLLWPFNPSYGIIVRESVLQEREFLNGFLGLHEDACNLMRGNPEEASRIVSGQLRVVDAAFAQTVFAISPHYCASLPQAYIKAAMAFVPVLREQGAIGRDLAADEVFDRSFISQVHPEAPHY